jgi:hypothetical protein
MSSVPPSVISTVSPRSSQAALPDMMSPNAAMGICTDSASVAMVGPISSTARAQK